MAQPHTPHLYKETEWQMHGKWFCADVSDLAHGSGVWYLPCRVLGISPAEFVKQLKEVYHCDTIRWTAQTPDGNGFLYYCWSSQVDMRKFKNYINSVARKKQFFI